MEFNDLYKRAQAEANALADKHNKGKKASLWACYPLTDDEQPPCPQFKVGKCYKCKGRVCYDPSHKTRLKVFNKKICTICLLKHHRDEIEPEIIEILEGNFQ